MLHKNGYGLVQADGLMRATTFWKTVTMDRTDFLEHLISVLDAEAVRYCVVPFLYPFPPTNWFSACPPPSLGLRPFP